MIDEFDMNCIDNGCERVGKGIVSILKTESGWGGGMEK